MTKLLVACHSRRILTINGTLLLLLCHVKMMKIHHSQRIFSPYLGRRLSRAHLALAPGAAPRQGPHQRGQDPQPLRARGENLKTKAGQGKNETKTAKTKMVMKIGELPRHILTMSRMWPLCRLSHLICRKKKW